MENIDDWLYIVFLAIAGISSLFSSVKRKRVQQPIPDQEDTDLEPPFGEPMEEMQSQRTFRMPDEVFQTRPADSDQATLSGQPAGADPAALMGKRRSQLKTHRRQQAKPRRLLLQEPHRKGAGWTIRTNCAGPSSVPKF